MLRKISYGPYYFTWLRSLTLVAACLLGAPQAHADQSSDIIKALQNRGISQPYLPQTAGNLTSPDDLADVIDQIAMRSNPEYLKEVSSHIAAAKGRISGALKCDKFETKGRHAFFHEWTFPPEPQAPEGAELYHDIWSFTGCGKTHRMHFMVSRIGSIPSKPTTILVGDTASSSILILDINNMLRMVAAVQLKVDNETPCTDSVPITFEAKVVNYNQPGQPWQEEWRVSYCKKIGTYTINFTPTPARAGGTSFAITFKSVKDE